MLNNTVKALVTRLEMERDSAKGDCIRLREETNALREDLQRLKEVQRCDQGRLDQAQKDFDNCVCQWEVERHGLTSQIKQLSEELRQSKDRLRELQADTTDHRTRTNHLKMVNEQTERELRTTQDLLHQTEAELTSALDRIQELNNESQQLQWQLREGKQERTSLKSNMTRLDQEKDSLLLKLDEKTEQYVRLEAEVESRDRRIGSLEGFIADLQKKLDVALDTAARSEQASRQHTQDIERLRKELDKMERCRDNAVRENSRLQDDLAALTQDHQQITHSLEASRREVEDLKLQLQQYVAEVRRITQILEEKEVERMQMLEHYRSLTVESANLETNNHSLESEARSNKSCLREAQTRIQDLEAKLQEKKAMVHGYEKQIKELTQQVAKLERKVDSRARAENANKDLSRELETQKHCLAQKVDQLSSDNKQLEEQVGNLRSDLVHLQEQLGKERKNSATLENVLASSRQETLQRSRDNSQLQAQVHCLETKLRELQDQLVHGSDALRRCESKCQDYQAQVADLRREVTNDQFERARVEETRSRLHPVLKRQKHTVPRSRSLTSLHSHNMSRAYVCPCCFLNKISSLRNTPQTSKELVNQKNRCEPRVNYSEQKIPTTSSDQLLYTDSNDKFKVINNIGTEYSDISTASDSSIAHNVESCNFGEGSEEFMVPERLPSERKKPKSSQSFSEGATFDDDSFLIVGKKQNISGTINPTDNTGMLADQIENILQEQKRFFKELDLPIRDDGMFTLELNQNVESDPPSGGDFVKTKVKKINNKKGLNKKIKTVIALPQKTVRFASGDQSNTSKVSESFNSNLFVKDGISSKESRVIRAKNKKPTFNFNEDPVKLSSVLKWPMPAQTDSNINKDYVTNKNVSVKMLFLPEYEMHCSNSSIGSQGESQSVTSSSVYVTAANSCTDNYKDVVYAAAGSTSTSCLTVVCCSSDSKELIESD